MLDELSIESFLLLTRNVQLSLRIFTLGSDVDFGVVEGKRLYLEGCLWYDSLSSFHFPPLLYDVLANKIFIAGGSLSHHRNLRVVHLCWSLAGVFVQTYLLSRF